MKKSICNFTHSVKVLKVLTKVVFNSHYGRMKNEGLKSLLQRCQLGQHDLRMLLQAGLCSFCARRMSVNTMSAQHSMPRRTSVNTMSARHSVLRRMSVNTMFAQHSVLRRMSVNTMPVQTVLLSLRRITVDRWLTQLSRTCNTLWFVFSAASSVHH